MVSIMPKVVRSYLKTWEEAIGVLHEVEKNVLIFETFILDIFPMTSSFFQKTHRFLGNRIAVIRTDLRDEPFRVRLVSNQ